MSGLSFVFFSSSSSQFYLVFLALAYLVHGHFVLCIIVRSEHFQE